MDARDNSTNCMDVTETPASDKAISPTDSVGNFASISDAVHGSASNTSSLPDATPPPNPHPPLNPSNATRSRAVHGQPSNHLAPRKHTKVVVHQPSPNNRVLVAASADDSWVWVDSPGPDGRVRSAASTADSVPSDNGRPKIAHHKNWRAVDEVLYRDGDNCQIVFYRMPDIPSGLMLRFALRGHASSSIDFANASGFSNDLVLALKNQIAQCGRQRLRGFRGNRGRTVEYLTPSVFSALESWKNWPMQLENPNWKACAHCIDAQDKEPKPTLPQSLLACSWGD